MRGSLSCAVAMFGLLLFAHSDLSVAEQPNGWSSLEVLFEDASETASTRPAAIVTDKLGRAHVFWLYKRVRDDRSSWSINYMVWQEGEWSEPYDVLLTPGGGAGAPRVVVDSGGMLHVIWADGGRLYYARSPANSAASSRSWTRPTVIADGVVDADLALDPTQGLHVVYATGERYGALYHVLGASDDWSPATPAFHGTDEDSTAIAPRLSIDSRGRIHVTWGMFALPSGWPPTGQYYMRSVDDGLSWDVPTQVGGQEQGDGTVLAVGADEIHLVWRGTSGAGNTYHQFSLDGGETWVGPTVFDRDGGFSGPGSLAVDSAGVLHLVRGDGGYQRWNGSRWLPVPALFADSGETGTLAIGLGNTLHWLNTSCASCAPANLLHRVAVTTAPRLTPQSDETPPERAPEEYHLESVQVTAAIPPIAVTDAPASWQGAVPSKSGLSSQYLAVLLGVLPAAILTAGILSWCLRRSQRS